MFVGKRGGRVRWCSICRENYRDWGKKTPEEKAAIQRRGVPSLPDLRARLFQGSHGNPKLGGIPRSITSRVTCPPSCGLFEAGCYGEYHVLAHHWRQVGLRGDTWRDFCDDVAALPEGQLWRHNEVGDLPGVGNELDRAALGQLVAANKGRRGFTFTHKHVSHDNRLAIREANRKGFTINLSAESLDEADELASWEVGPVAVVLPSDAPDVRVRTAGGRHVIVCPEQRGILTCATCALCAIPTRKAIIGFRAHGQAVAAVDKLVQLRVPTSPASAAPVAACLPASP